METTVDKENTQWHISRRFWGFDSHRNTDYSQKDWIIKFLPGISVSFSVSFFVIKSAHKAVSVNNSTKGKAH